MHARLKNEFTEDEKCHNLVLNYTCTVHFAKFAILLTLCNFWAVLCNIKSLHGVDNTMRIFQ